MKLINDYLTLIKNPEKFFSAKGKEKKYTGPLYFFVILYVIYYLFEVLTASIHYFRGLLEVREFYMVFLAFLLLVIVVWILPFIISSITYLGVVIFKGKTKFFEVFKAVTYSSTIYVIYGLLLVLISIVYTIITREVLPLEGTTGTILNLIFLLSLIHLVYLQMISISKYTGLSKVKSFFAVLIIPTLLFISIIILTLILVLSNPVATVPF